MIRTLTPQSRASVESQVVQALRGYKDGTVVEIIIRKANKRSLEQNRYYHAVVCKLYAAHLTERTGKPYTGEQAHDLLRASLLTVWLDNPLTGESREVLSSTTKLTVGEMEQYLERCRQYLWETFSLHVPLPNESTT